MSDIVLVRNILLFWVLFSCSKTDIKQSDGLQIPNEGMFVSWQFAENQIVYHTDLIYSTRANFKISTENYQYTSELTKNTELQQDELQLKLNLALPPNATATSRVPLLVFIHGGDFMAGDKSAHISEIKSYVRAGYAVASINYRLTKNNLDNASLRAKAIADALEDTQNAIRYLKSKADEYHLDSSRVAVLGSSAGGALSQLNAIEADMYGLANDYNGYTSRVSACISTGATLMNDQITTPPITWRFDATDTPIMLFFAYTTDNVSGYTWQASAVATANLINNSGNQCFLVKQPHMSHVVDLDLGGIYWKFLKPFLWEKLRLGEL